MTMPVCDMGRGCAGKVTHIGDKGYVYCAEHAQQRRSAGYERTRSMKVWERRAVRNGEALLSYWPSSYSEHVAHYGTPGTTPEPATEGIAR